MPYGECDGSSAGTTLCARPVDDSQWENLSEKAISDSELNSILQYHKLPITRAADLLWVTSEAIYMFDEERHNRNLIIVIPRKITDPSCNTLSDVDQSVLLKLLLDVDKNFTTHFNIRKWSIRVDSTDYNGCARFHLKIGVHFKILKYLLHNRAPLS